MREFEIFWDDLSSEAKQRLISEGFEAHENIGILPIAIINQEEEVEKGFRFLSTLKNRYRL